MKNFTCKRSVFQRSCGGFNLTFLAKLFTQSRFPHGCYILNSNWFDLSKHLMRFVYFFMLMLLFEVYSWRHPLIFQAKRFDHSGNNISHSFFTSPLGFFALIIDPKVIVVTETINSNKTKLRWSIFNLENNKNTEQSFPVTRISTHFPKVALEAISVNLDMTLLCDTLKIENTKSWVSVFQVVSISA